MEEKVKKEILEVLVKLVENFPEEVLKDQMGEDYELFENIIKRFEIKLGE